MNQNNDILYSIIIPTYNRAGFLNRPISSVLNQTYTNWELIIIDDGSTDNTKNIVDRYSDPRIHYIYQDNQERSAARNNGIIKAKGEYICFLDSDDYYLENHLNDINTFILENQKKEFIFTNFQYLIDGVQTKYEIEAYEQGYSIIDYILCNPIATGRAVVKSELLHTNQFNPNIRIGEDIELWSRIANNNNAAHLKIESYIQVEHNDRSIRTESSKTLFQHLETLRVIASNVQSIKIYKLNEAYSYAYLKIGDALLDEGKKVKALKNYLKGLFIKPGYLTKRFMYQILQCFKTSKQS